MILITHHGLSLHVIDRDLIETFHRFNCRLHSGPRNARSVVSPLRGHFSNQICVPLEDHAGRHVDENPQVSLRAASSSNFTIPSFPTLAAILAPSGDQAMGRSSQMSHGLSNASSVAKCLA